MRRKKDMYINYGNSYRRGRRGRRRGSFRAIKIILTVMLAIAVSLAVFFIIKSQIDFTGLEKKKNDYSSNSEGDKALDGLVVDDTDMETEVVPTAEPTVTPEAEEGEEVTQVIERAPVKAKGIYVTSAKANSEDFARLIDIADTTEINAMVIDVKGDTGKIAYHMDSPLAKEINATTNVISDMEGLVKALKEKDIYLIARIVAFKDPYAAEQKHEWAIKNKDGSLYRDNNGECWVNPYNHEVWDYLIEVSTKAAEIGFDEIQFDYIRFSTGKGIAEADFGEESETKSKEDIIIEFTKYAYEKLKPLGVFVAADVYGTIISSSIDAGLVGQNYVEMAKYLDYICPMIYPSHFGEGNYGIEHPDLEPLLIVRKVLNASKEKLEEIPEGEHRAIVRPWLQDFTASWIKHYMVYGGEEVRAQIDGVYEAGYDEWLLWNASTNYSVEGLLQE